MNMPRPFALAASLALAATAAAATPRILPSGDSVPENLLRIELALDTPLSGPLDMTRVALSDASGRRIDAPFLDLPLASTDGRRITLLMHPGRVKTGVGPNTAAGLALQAGQMVTLTVSDPQLPAVLVKSWRVEPAQRKALDPRSWHWSVPRAGSREPLQLSFPAALGAHAVELIAVASADGRRMAGRATLVDGEARWRFSPQGAWQAGAYELRLHPGLEDPQGNRLCSAFEQERQSALACTEDARIPFIVAARAGRAPGTLATP